MAASGKDIFDVFPTPMAKQIMKTRIGTAKRGHDILEKKVKVLEMEFRKVAKEIIRAKSSIGDIFKDAAILSAEARYVSGDFNQMVISGTENARLKVTKKIDNVAGIKLTKFELTSGGEDSFTMTGLAKGGEKILSLKQSYAKAVEILVDLASLEYTFKVLEENIKSVKRRVNALEQIYIPKCNRTMQYIVEEMDERERQEFFRLKKIKDIKKRMMEEKIQIRDEMTGREDEGSFLVVV